MSLPTLARAMETEPGGDKLTEVAMPGRGKKRPLSPASSAASSPSDDDRWEFSNEEQEGGNDVEDDQGMGPAVRVVNNNMRYLNQIQIRRNEIMQDLWDTRPQARQKQAVRGRKIMYVDEEDDQGMGPAVRVLNNNMRYLNQIQIRRNEIIQGLLDTRPQSRQKQAARGRKIMYVQQLARECGTTEETPQLWLGVLKIILHESVMNFFIGTKPEGRMAVIKHYAKEDVESATEVYSNDESDEWWLSFFLEACEDDDIMIVYMHCVCEYAMHIDKYCTRAEYRQPAMSGQEWVDRKLENRNACYNLYSEEEEEEEGKNDDEDYPGMSLAVRDMDNNMRHFNQVQINMNEMMQSILDKRQQAIRDKETKIIYVQQLARECGATEETPQLWLGVLKIVLHESWMHFFTVDKPEDRMSMIKHCAMVDI